MLKHRLARRLSTLFMLVAVLGVLPTSANRQAAPTNRGPYCQREVTWDGVCVEICCTGAGCMATAC